MRRTETGAVQRIQKQQQNAVNEYDVQMSRLRELFGGATSVLSEHGQVDDATRNLLELDEFDGARTIPERFVVGVCESRGRLARSNCSGGEWRERRRTTECQKGVLSSIEVGRRSAQAHDTRRVRVGTVLL